MKIKEIIDMLKDHPDEYKIQFWLGDKKVSVGIDLILSSDVSKITDVMLEELED